MSAAKRTSGFTVIELVVVIAIAAALMVVSIPAITTWLPNYKLRGAATDLYSRIQYAKSEAIRTNSEYAVVFDPGNAEYKLVSSGADGVIGGGDDVDQEVTRIVDYGPGIAYGFNHVPAIDQNFDDGTNDFSAGVVSFNASTVVFDGRGMCNAGSVYLQNNSNRNYAVGTRMSGVVRIARWVGSSWQ